MKPRSSLIASAVVMTVEETDDNHADWKWDFPLGYDIRVPYFRKPQILIINRQAVLIAIL